MNVELIETEVRELDRLLTMVLGDMSMEIAGTDNAGYKRDLDDRRQVLEAVQRKLSA
jgi:hypothetical protein